MQKYVEDVCSVFNSEYVHIGLDEPFDFCICDRCKARMEAGETKADIFYKHIMKTYYHIKSLGKIFICSF